MPNTASRNTAVSSPSRRTAKNAMPTSAQDRAGDERGLGALLERALQLAGVALHPDDHVGDARDGHQGEDRLQPFLLFVRERPVDGLQDQRHRQAQRDRQADPVPHRSQRLALPALDQERGDDPDDERGLEAFAESDDEGGQHAAFLSLRST